MPKNAIMKDMFEQDSQNSKMIRCKNFIAAPFFLISNFALVLTVTISKIFIKSANNLKSKLSNVS